MALHGDALHPIQCRGCLHRDLGEPAALGKDTQFPEQMNGAVSRARLGIDRWPLFGYYFALVWGTIALMARPGKP